MYELVDWTYKAIAVLWMAMTTMMLMEINDAISNL